MESTTNIGAGTGTGNDAGKLGAVLPEGITVSPFGVAENLETKMSPEKSDENKNKKSNKQKSANIDNSLLVFNVSKD